MKSRTGRVNSFDDEIPNTGADGTVGERAGAGRAVRVTVRRRPGTVDGGGAAGAGPGRELGRYGPRLRGQRRSAGAGVERNDVMESGCGTRCFVLRRVNQRLRSRDGGLEREKKRACRVFEGPAGQWIRRDTMVT